MTALTTALSAAPLERVSRVFYVDEVTDEGEQLLDAALRDRLELVDGQLQEKPGMSMESGEVTALLTAEVVPFVRKRGLGKVMTETTSYRCFPHKPDGTRRPDLSFIRADRVTPAMMHGHVPIAPDLAVEVVSPRDGMNDVSERVNDYLRAGTPLVWVLLPGVGCAFVHRGDGSVTRVHAGEGGELDGESVLPGFRCPLADLYPVAAEAPAEASPADV